VRYGGNTSCTEVRADDGTLIVLDCGTGAHALGQSIVSGGPVGAGRLLISHTHWDHIQGLPFFTPLYLAGYEWDVYGPGGLGSHIETTLAGQQEYTYFPIRLNDLSATARFHDLTEGDFTVGGVEVTASYLNHTAVTLGYRLRAGAAEIVYATDHEPHWSDPADAWGDSVRVHSEDQRHIDFLAGADLVIHDAQYLLSDFPAKAGWGHSPAERAVDYCMAAGVKRLALFHHDPLRDDDQLDWLVDHCRLRAGQSSLEVFGATEGQEIILPEGSRSAARPISVRETVAIAADPPMARGETILVVDDEPDIVDLISLALKADGYRIETAFDGKAALRRAHEQRPALVLLDWRLPGMDGPEVCRRLRADADAALSQIPVVLVTGMSDSENVAAGFEAGASDYLTKSFSPAYLRSRVRAWLLRAPTRAGRVVEEVHPEFGQQPRTAY